MGLLEEVVTWSITASVASEDQMKRKLTREISKNRGGDDFLWEQDPLPHRHRDDYRRAMAPEQPLSWREKEQQQLADQREIQRLKDEI